MWLVVVAWINLYVHVSLSLFPPVSVACPISTSRYNVATYSLAVERLPEPTPWNNLDANSRPGAPSSESHLRESDPRERGTEKSKVKRRQVSSAAAPRLFHSKILYREIFV